MSWVAVGRGEELVGGMGVVISVGIAVSVTSPGVAVTTNAVHIGRPVRECGVTLASSVIVGTKVGVAVMKAGLPYSRQHRSGAAPVNPVSGLTGAGSQLAVIYCVTP